MIEFPFWIGSIGWFILILFWLSIAFILYLSIKYINDMELIQLIKMLFSSKPSDFNEPQMLEMKHFPFSGYKYMMWCGRMIYRSSKRDRILSEIGTESHKRSITHETIHLKQAQICGTWIKFYWKYFCEWIKGNPIIHPASGAYYTIPFEMEAYANEDNPDYAKEYTGESLHCYKIKNRKKTYKQHSGKQRWKEFLKTISIR